MYYKMYLAEIIKEGANNNPDLSKVLSNYSLTNVDKERDIVV